MKRFSGIMLMAFLFFLSAGQEVLHAQKLVFADSLDFGTILEKDGKVVRSFTFRNDTGTDVTVCDLTTACRCIVGETSFKTVAPGETGDIKLTFDPAYRSGPFRYSVAVWYADKARYQYVTVTGSVVPMSHPIEEDHPYSMGGGLYTSHKVLPFGHIGHGQTKKMFFRYGNGTDKPMTVKFVVEGCCARTIGMEKELSLAPDERGKLYVSITMPYGYEGSHVNRIWIYVNGVRQENPLLVKMISGNGK